MQAMLEHLKQVAQKKSSKHREKLEHVLESSFRQVETTLHNALKDEESKFQQGAEKMNAYVTKRCAFFQVVFKLLYCSC